MVKAIEKRPFLCETVSYNRSALIESCHTKVALQVIPTNNSFVTLNGTHSPASEIALSAPSQIQVQTHNEPVVSELAHPSLCWQSDILDQGAGGSPCSSEMK